MAFNLHYLVPDPDGPIKSAPAGSTFKIGRNARHVVACSPTMELTEVHRGTHEPWLVECNACKATQVYKDTYYPRPGAVPQDDLDPNLAAGCC